MARGNGIPREFAVPLCGLAFPLNKYPAFAETSAPELRHLALSGRRRNSKHTRQLNFPLNKYSAFLPKRRLRNYAVLPCRGDCGTANTPVSSIFPSTNTPLFCRNVGSGITPSCPVGETAEQQTHLSAQFSPQQILRFF